MRKRRANTLLWIVQIRDEVCRVLMLQCRNVKPAALTHVRYLDHRVVCVRYVLNALQKVSVIKSSGKLTARLPTSRTRRAVSASSRSSDGRGNMWVQFPRLRVRSAMAIAVLSISYRLPCALCGCDDDESQRGYFYLRIKRNQLDWRLGKVFCA